MNVLDATADDLPELRAFSNRFIKPDSSTFSDDFFSWQYEQSSQLVGDGAGNGTLIARHDDGRIVSVLVGQRLQLWAGGRVLTGVWDHEWYSHPALPGVGMTLLRRQINEHGFIGFAGPSLQSLSVTNLVSPMTWYECERLFSVVDADATFSLLLASCKDARRFLAEKCIPVAPPGIRLEMVEYFDESYEATWRNFRATVIWASDRTAPYMTWRYLRHPRFSYQVAKITTPAGLAFFVWREEPVHGHEKKVARLCEAIGAQDALTAAYPELHTFFKGRNISFADFFCSHMPTNAALMEGGMRVAITLPDFNLPRLFSPLSGDAHKRLGFAAGFPRGREFEVRDRHHLAYITKGDGNQDRPNP